LKASLVQFVKDNQIEAGIVVSCVGSLMQYNLRFAGQTAGHLEKGSFEILSLTGTVSTQGVHLHLGLADAHGNTVGGHLLDHNLIYTTAEITLAHLLDLRFSREVDPRYGYRELKVEPYKP
jgi:predicted DNA-binding protein with PD1-like motif